MMGFVDDGDDGHDGVVDGGCGHDGGCGLTGL